MAKILFDSVRAREAQQKSVLARRAAALAVIERRQTAVAAMDVAESTAPIADYAARRLARVRAQLDALDDQIATAIASPSLNGRLLNDLAAAQARLATQEQQLAGRPLPGSRRPGKERPARLSSGAQELEPLD